jgi:hypothetical protein
MLQTNPVARISPTDPHWTAFVDSLPEANIFHHPAWVNLLSECYGYKSFVIPYLDSQDNISAGVPIIEVRSFLTGNRWVCLPFTDYCQPLYRDRNALEGLAQRIVDLSLVDQNPPIEVRWELPPSQRIQSYSHFVRHTIKLDRDLEAISRSLHRTQRQNIKTAEKNSIQIKRGSDIDYLHSFYKLHSLTRHRQGVPVQPWRFFELVLKKIIQQGNGFILLAYKDNDCLAAGLFLHWHQTLCYKYAASADEGQDLRPNHLLTWEAIQWGHENGYTVLDFGRTDVENAGLRTFKCRWGADETALYYSLSSDESPKKSEGRLTSLMNLILKKTPPWVSRAAGELLYKHYG